MKHDKVLSKKPPAPHLRDVPDYLLDATTKEASKTVKLARAAMGNPNPARRSGLKKNSKRTRAPSRLSLPRYLNFSLRDVFMIVSRVSFTEAIYKEASSQPLLAETGFS